jgi:hypothetical protein
MTTVTIHGKDTRVALEAALWHAMSHVADHLGDDLYGCAAAGIRCDQDFPEVVKEAQGKFLRFEWLQKDLRTVRNTATGEGLDLDSLESISAQALCESLRACRDLVEDWEEFWKQSVEQRRTATWRRDAIVELLDESSSAVA